MNFISYLKFEDISKIENKKNYIYFQFLPHFKDLPNINTDIYAQYELTSKGARILPDYNQILKLFLESSVYTGELVSFCNKEEKIYDDTKSIINKINNFKGVVYFRDIMDFNSGTSYYLNQIKNSPIVSFVKYN